MLQGLFPEGLELLEDDDFQFFREKVFMISGISMTEAKRELIQSRLKSRVYAMGLGSLNEYRKFIEKLPDTHSEWQEFTNQLTTNKTEFFREPKHFTYLEEQFIPEWKKRSTGKPLSVWCAASSTGEEPYTLAMVLTKLVRDVRILATDIDTAVLTKAANGVYSAHQLSEVPEAYHSCFERGKGEISDWVRVRDEIRKVVKFDQVNLTNLPPMKVKFDLIFCRNVLIYFTKETVQSVTEGLYENVKMGGELIISHTESLNTSTSKEKSSWSFIRPSIYRKTR